MRKYVQFSKFLPYADGDRVIDGDLSGVISVLEKMGVRHEVRTRRGFMGAGYHRKIIQTAVFADAEQLARRGITLTDISAKRGPHKKVVEKIILIGNPPMP